ncbi:MAG: DUF4893 domain-containing protein [Akkermansiaceae bacterium]
MKNLTLVLLATSSLAIAQEAETEKEWKVIANPADISIENAAIAFLKKAEPLPKLQAKEKTEIKRLKDLVSGERLKLVPNDLPKLKKVRSIQITQYGVFSYPYFNCRFKKTERGIFFEKTTGSQRKSGLVFQDDDRSLVFLGASTVNNDPQRQYSGFTRAKDKSHDSAGLIIKRGKTYLAIFPKKNNNWEIYEFK